MGLSHTFPNDIDMLLVNPAGQGVIIMAHVGGSFGINNVTLTLDDAAANSLPNTQIVSGTYKPTNHGAGNVFTAPAPAGPYGATLSTFNGSVPNGAWSLYIVDDTANDHGTLAGGWSLTLGSAGNSPPTISAIVNQITLTNTSTAPIPFTVGDFQTPATNLVVTGQSSNTNLLPNANIVLGGSGSNRTVTLTPGANQTGTSTVTLTVTDGGGATASTSFLLTVTGPSGSFSFTNSTSVSIPDVGNATPYPSVINVSGLSGAVSKVTVTLMGLSHTFPNDIDMLLVGPAGQDVIIMAHVGGSFGIINVTLTLDDAAVNSLPNTQIVSGTYKPTDHAAGIVFPSPARPGPFGTTLSVFSNTVANGAWSLFVLDDTANDHGTMAGWSLTITTGTNAPPPLGNDAFAGALVISGSSGLVNGNNSTATKEPGEPNHAGNTGGASLWYSWTAPSSSPATFDTALSGFDTLLAVYTGSTVSNLVQVAANDNMNGNTTCSRLTFTPVSGTTYKIAVDGANGAKGALTLRWAQATTPLPDLGLVASAVNPQITTETFAASSCAVMEGLIQAGTRRLIRFSTQTENQGTADLYLGNPANNPLFVWAPCHAHYHFNNYMAYRLRDANGQIAAVGLKVGFCILDVFRWDPNAASTTLYSCTNQGIQRGWGDLYGPTLDGQWIDITGLPDGSYTIELEANPIGIVQESNYTNNIVQVPILIGNTNAPPLNDNFASAQTLLGSFTSVPGFSANATKEPGEPNHAGNPGGHSVWYQWTALDTKAVTIDTLGSSFNTLLAVYTGSSLTSLSLVASNDDIGPGQLQSRVTFSATSGTVYKIAVDGYDGASGNLILTLNQTIQNDNFANAEFIGGAGGIDYGSNLGATKEPGEPNHAGNSGGASIWYAWTAPINGAATFDTLGSSFNTLLGVYTGSSVSSLTTIASNDDIDPANGVLQSSVTFNAVGLSRYYIAIDGFNGVTGDTVLNWSLISGGSSLASATMSPAKRAAAAIQASRPRLAENFVFEGAVQLTIAGLPLQQYCIERSCDLVHWIPMVTTVADVSGTAYFIDKSTMHHDRQSPSGDPFCGAGGIAGVKLGPESRFYRAVLLGSK
jgi:subtilisin-like proprotein convertase family protein